MSTDDTAAPKVYTYGGWRLPAQGGLGKWSLGQTIGLLAAAFGGVLVNWWLGLAWAIVYFALLAGTAVALSIKDKHGLSITDKRRERRMWRKARRRQANIFRNGVLSVNKKASGRCALPGVLGRLRISEHTDAYRRPFAVLHHGDGRLSVVMSLGPAGIALVDKETVDRHVALWGLWLSDLSDETGIVDASVTVETAPDSGDVLRRESQSQRSREAPEIAAAVIEGVVNRAGAAGARIRTWATISFDPALMSSESRGRTERAIRDIASRLPGLTQTLAAAGAGSVHLMTVDELTQLVRCAYDPEAEALFDAAAAQGHQVDLDWSEAGPISQDAEWDYVRHDSGLSRSWVMTRAPRGTVQSSVLRRLLDVSRDIARKRVTIMYKPMDSAKAPDVVERDVDKAANKRRTATRPTARMDRDLAQARKTSEEEASGASILDFGLVMTATVVDDGQSDPHAQLADASSAMESLAGSSRLTVRTAYGAQDSAFALTLPLGLTPQRQSLIGGW
ncbi:SCO6880 family protein [Actinomyces succiniciruminis]|uniref:Integral membrane protein n=1 Tax=Actinomyces succiniciruminis TaxID=1522002 RepID=A0A1L7RBM8_9ACTO|nr:SCO6880 family protein [Actinomyces succiniciruminis]CED91295.1 Integral membrane protein [Actinomyces succiniciruminis]